MARYGCTITVATGELPSSQSNFAWVATEANFPTAAKDGGSQSILNGGGNLRCYVDSTKSTQLPVAIVKFVTGGTPDIQVFGKSPTLGVGSTVYIEADTVATTQPAVTDTYGRNAVFSEYVSAYVGDDGTDFAGNFDLTSSGTGSISSTTNDSNMSGISFDGAVSLKNTSWTKLGYPLSFSMWGYRDPSAATQVVISQGDPSGASWDSLLIRIGDRYEINTNNGTNRADTTSIPDNTWDYVTANIDTDDFEIIVDTVVRGTGSSGTQAPGSMTEFALGELVRSGSSLYYEGDLSAVLVKDSAISSDEHESMYNNQSSPSTFWTTSAWTDQDAGGLTITPTGIASAEVFGTADIFLNDAFVSTTGIASQEVIGSHSLLNTEVLAPSSISSLEAIGSPVLLTGGVTLTASGIASQEAVQEPTLVYAQIVSTTGISGAEQFGIAIIQDGVGVIIPVTDRDTYQKIAAYLDGTGRFVSTQNNDIIVEWLRSEGINTGHFNSSFFEYWGQKGYTGAYNDRWKEWKNS